MKLCKSNIFVNKIFLNDPEPNLNIFGYDGIPGVPRVLINGLPEITVQDFGDHFYIQPLRFDSEKQFNLLVIEALIKACEINGNTTHSMGMGLEHFTSKDIPLGWILVSKEFEFPDNITQDVFIKYLDPFVIKVNGLNNKQILLTPQAGFLGVVAISGDNLDKYAVGIGNSAAPILVELP